VQRSAGNVLTLCGEQEDAQQGGEIVEQRFLSVPGSGDQTVLEFVNPSFAVLWGRLCVSRDETW
jgi:hypothetical protein